MFSIMYSGRGDTCTVGLGMHCIDFVPLPYESS